MELKISKIQWKKVLAFVLTLCMTITMVQIPVNAEETTQPVNSPKHFDVWDLEDYEETATFFDAAEDRTAIDVQPMEENQTYTVDPTTGYYDAKWFSFTPSEDGMYTFKANEEEKNSIACLLEKTSSGEYRYIECNDYYEINDYDYYDLFCIRAGLHKDKTYYLCTGWYTKKNKEQYSFNVSKDEESVLSSEPVTYNNKLGDKIYSFTAPKTGCYMLKYEWKNNGNPYAGVIENEKVTHNNEQVELIDGPQGETERIYYLFCEAGEKYYLNQSGFRVDDKSADVNISVVPKNIQNISVANPEKIVSGTTGEIFEFKADEDGYYKLNLDWGEAESIKSAINGSYSIINAKGKEITNGYRYFSSANDLKPFYVQKGKKYYLIINSLIFTNYDGQKVDNQEAKLEILQDEKNKEEEITTTKPGEFTSKSLTVNKIYKFVPTNSDYYSIEFVPQTDLGLEPNIGWNIDLEDSEGDVKSLTPAREYNNTYLEKGKSYYINVKSCTVYDHDDVTFKIQISPVPVEEIDYSTSGKVTTSYNNNENKIFKFTAQYTGKHVLKYSWNDEGAKLWYAEPNIEKNVITGMSYKEIKTEKNAAYQSVYCKKGDTYYFDLESVAFKSRTTNKPIDVDMSFSVAYYNGKTDLGTIKNTQPWIPGKDNGETGKPNDGKNDNPGIDKKDDNTSIVKPTEIKVSSIKIAALSNKIAAGKKVKLAATIAPENASNKAVKWTTSNKKVAKVSQSGVVTVNKKAAGKSVVITAIAADGSGARATYKIKVMKDAVKRLTVTGKKVVKAGKKIKLKAKVVAGKKANKKLVWTSSNTKFATVNQKGIVKTTKAGKGKKVKITARTTDGSNKKKVFVIRIK